MPTLRLDGDAAGAVKATSEVTAGVKKIKSNFDEAATSAKQLERAAAQIVKANEGPQDTYNRKMAELAKLTREGKLSYEQAAIAAKRYHADLHAAANKNLQGIGLELRAQQLKNESLARMNAAVRTVGEAQQQSFGPASLANLQSYVMGLVSIQTVISVIRGEMEAIKREAEKTNQSQLTAFDARSVLKRNIASLGIEKARGLEKQADSLSGEIGIEQWHVDNALASAISTSDNENQALNRVRLASKYLPDSPEAFGIFAGSLGDLAAATRDNNDMRNLGFMLTVGAQSRVTDDQKLAEQLPKAISGAVTYGATPEEAGALFDAISTKTADTEGRTTGTAVLQLTEQMRDKVKGGSFRERLGMLRADPELAKEFIEKASFEVKAKGAIEELILNKDSLISRSYESLLGSFGTPESQIKTAEDLLSYLGEGRIAKTAGVERVIGARTNQFRLSQDADLSDKSREDVVERSRQLTGRLSWTNRAGIVLRTGVTMSPEEAISELETASRGRLMEGRIGEEKDAELVENTRLMIEELRTLIQVVDKKQPEHIPISGRQE